MSGSEVPMEITQGEDWTTDVIWTDSFNVGVNVIHPCRMDLKNSSGNAVLSLETNPAIPAGEIPEINLSSDIGLIQLHIARSESAALVPGTYYYDLFVTTDDGGYAGPQVQQLVYGTVTVNQRVTEL